MREYRFDVVRVVCMTYLVAFFHLSGYVYPNGLTGVCHSLSMALAHASLGLFTFVSGYLLGRKYRFGQPESVGVWTFYKKRILRVFPLFVLASVALWLIGLNGARATLNGLLCISSGDNKCLDIVNFTTPTVGVTSLTDITTGCLMWNTTYIAYINDDSSKLIIYDITTSTIIYEFTLPASLDTSIYYVMAHTNYVFILTATQTFICDIRNGNFTNSMTVIPIRSGSTDRGPLYKCVSNMLITYGNTQVGYNDSVACISIDDITNIKILNDQKLNPAYGFSSYTLIGSQIAEVGNSLCMLTAATRNSDNQPWFYRVIDIGLYMNANDWDSNVYVTTETSSFVRGFIYDQHFILDSTMIPLINFLSIKITGTTQTITSINHSKSLSNKEFSISFSNTPTFYGKPPGSLN